MHPGTIYRTSPPPANWPYGVYLVFKEATVSILSNGVYSHYVDDAAFQALYRHTPSGPALAIFALGLTGEAGATAELVKKYLDRDKPIDKEVMKLELGDVLWYLQALANFFDLTLEEIAAANIAKLDARRAQQAKIA
jgi:NTP pyrophosphatase (non-canonical NTP hydrolase)